MQMCVQGCHFLRFLKKNTWRHVRDQYVVRMQKGIKIGPVVLHIFQVYIRWAKKKFSTFGRVMLHLHYVYTCSVQLMWKLYPSCVLWYLTFYILTTGYHIPLQTVSKGQEIKYHKSVQITHILRLRIAFLCHLKKYYLG